VSTDNYANEDRGKPRYFLGEKEATRKKLFDSSCAACHAGGGNTVIEGKGLQADTLQAFGFAEKSDIARQIKEGKGSMPAFGGASL